VAIVVPGGAEPYRLDLAGICTNATFGDTWEPRRRQAATSPGSSLAVRGSSGEDASGLLVTCSVGAEHVCVNRADHVRRDALRTNMKSGMPFCAINFNPARMSTLFVRAVSASTAHR